ncbi:MAG TPA: radical SAM protein [Candidatus Eisenbacteria bacterium]
MTHDRRNPCELEIDLFCHGVRIDPSCTLFEDARKVSRTRAGLGSGLELILPGPLKDIWMNAPVEEDFVRSSPYVLQKGGDGYAVRDERSGAVYGVRVPVEPAWYSRRTSRGTEMCKVGVLQGTYLGVYIANSCLFWYSNPPMNCRFCTTGSNVGVNEVAQKEVEDVVEVALAAKAESGVTFVHLNSGHQAGRDLAVAEPYVRALKERVGILAGVQLMPSKDLAAYDRLIDLGVDHFSFCYEFQNPAYFERYLPGKQRWFGQQVFFDALEYTSRRLGKGAVSGEIIAGVEPIEDTIRAIDYITGAGAFPTVCVFRPVIGADMEGHPAPRYDEMHAVFEHVYEACRRNGIPIGAAPNIEVSLIVQPDDTRYLAKRSLATWLYEARLALVRRAARPLFTRKMQPGPRVTTSPTPMPPGETTPIGKPNGNGGNRHGAEAAAPPNPAPPNPVAPDAAARDGEPDGAARRDAAMERVFGLLRDAARDHSGTFEVAERPAILEVIPRNLVRDAENRCRLKLFRPREDKDRLCAFFYKRSNLAWSRDRFSYGAVEFLPEDVSPGDLSTWLAWLRDGFDPDRRPQHLRRAFLYTIPE